MKPFRKHVAIAVDGGGIKGGIGITEATEWIESTEGPSVPSVIQTSVAHRADR